ncbi:bifunctional 2-polyprenyl-6-hydroxyphenol methylase/3-demethylubiquinol 3-O-methyltransferase UbiG [Pedobacter sp. SYSU D00535]|uniref:class I SAM-dependent methyltransferase n=1 Tax=Pedobacter sp. SYSU D00535 TaxID=2810308 RepID=UPI001A974029|nr:class I SAM-dependent methyltransferase [Pedobacter sp. SYSU D00535]
MENQLTDREFWKSYWESKKNLAVPIPRNYLFHQQLTGIIEKEGVKTAIELGGFPGYYTIFLKKYFNLESTLFDYFVHAGILREVAEANDLAANEIKVIEADVFNYQPEASFDLVLSCGLIEHFEDTKDIIQRHLSFLKPGGTLFITLPNFTGVNGWVQKNFDQENYLKHNMKSMDVAMLGRVSEELGLKDISVDYFGGFSVWLENKDQKSALTKAFIKTLWYAGKIPTKILGFESKLLSPYIVLQAKK